MVLLYKRKTHGATSLTSNSAKRRRTIKKHHSFGSLKAKHRATSLRKHLISAESPSASFIAANNKIILEKKKEVDKKFRAFVDAREGKYGPNWRQYKSPSKSSSKTRRYAIDAAKSPSNSMIAAANRAAKQKRNKEKQDFDEYVAKMKRAHGSNWRNHMS